MTNETNYTLCKVSNCANCVYIIQKCFYFIIKNKSLIRCNLYHIKNNFNIVKYKSIKPRVISDATIIAIRHITLSSIKMRCRITIIFKEMIICNAS